MADDLIAALERAHRWYVELCLRRAAQPNDHAADERIRALVATLRAGGERAQVVALQEERDKLASIVRGWHWLAVGPDEMGDYLHQRELIKASEPYADPALKALAKR